MKPVEKDEAIAVAKYEIERALLGATEWELWEAGARAATLRPGNIEFSVEWGKLIFVWWDEGRAESWRVAAYLVAGAEIRLQVTRGLGREMRRVALRDPARWAPPATEASLPAQRAAFGRQLAAWVARAFPAARLLRATTGADRAHSVTGGYGRLTLRLGRETVLVIGASAAETQPGIDAILATALVWLEVFNRRRAAAQARRLWICLPAGRSRTALERLTWLDAAPFGARIECFETDEAAGSLTPLRPVTQTELLNAHPQDALWPRSVIRSDFWRARICALAPDLIETRERPHRAGECFSIHGLEFARIEGADAPVVRFGVAGVQQDALLTGARMPALARLVEEIARVRRADSPDRRHPFYRLRAEAWLESLLRRDIRAFDPGLDERFVYSQVPTWRGDERSVIDLLGVDHEGRLVVIEIKVDEDRLLPLQGLDYWIRVEQARLRGEFARRGLFPGLALADRPPRLYLVAPRLRFHRACATVARCLSPEVEAFMIGINDNWRDGVRIRSRDALTQR